MPEVSVETIACKRAIRLLTGSGRCVHSYPGGSCIPLPPKGDSASSGH